MPRHLTYCDWHVRWAYGAFALAAGLSGAVQNTELIFIAGIAEIAVGKQKLTTIIQN